MTVKKIKSHVFVYGPVSKRDMARIQKYQSTSMLTLTGICLDSLPDLSGWKELESVRMYRCQIGITRLPRQKQLKELWVNGIRARDPDLSFLSELRRLKELGIGYVPHLKSLPDLSGCKWLTRLKIFNCKRLRDISAVLEIPKLQSFHIVETPFGPDDLEDVMKLPTLQSMTGAFKGKGNNERFHSLLKKHGLTYGG